MKVQFKNYNYDFNKVERKFLLQFCKQTLKSMPSEQKYQAEIKLYESIQQKLESTEDVVKFTKDELVRFEFAIKENLKHLEKQLKTVGFFKRWLLKSVHIQYKNIIDCHFSGK